MKLYLPLIFFGILQIVSAQNPNETADQLYATGNYSKAIEAYKSSANRDAVYDKIAKAYVALGNYEQALSNYEKAIIANPDDELIQYAYAKLLARTKNYDEASGYFKKLIASNSINPNYHFELGLILEKQKDSLALNQFITAYGLDKTHQKAIFKIAKHHLIKRRFKMAQRYVDKGLESYANNVELISLKAQAYYHQEYYTHAIEWFNKLIHLGEESEFIHEKLSLSYAQNSDYKEAIKHRKLALNYNPLDANAMFVIGTYYERINDFKNAETYIKSALKIQDVPFGAEYRRLGTVLNRQKKFEAAIKAFQKSLREDPTDIMAEFYLIRTKDEFYADLDAKIKMYEKFVLKHEKSPFLSFAKNRLKELKQEKFLEED